MANGKNNNKNRNIKTQLQQSKGITTPVPSRPGQSTPNQVTLPSRDTREEFTNCCWPENHANEWANREYPQASMCSNFVTAGDFVIVAGTIYIDGVPSTNPLQCTGNETDTYENCLEPFVVGENNWSNQDQCYPCDTDIDCPTASWPGHYECKNFFPDCNGHPRVCMFTENYPWPNYGMYNKYEPTGNADALGAMYKDQIIGIEFVNNMNSPGITLWLQHNITGYTNDCNPQAGYPSYPPVGKIWHHLILWQASTGNYYQLTEESYDLFFNSQWHSGTTGPPPLSGTNIGFFIGDLHFELSNIEPEYGPDCINCEQFYNPDWNDDANYQECEYYGKESGCAYQIVSGVTTCHCVNPERGCCEGIEQADPNSCINDRDCREGSRCIRGMCHLMPPQLDPSTIVDCSCEGTNPYCETVTTSYENGEYDLEQAEDYCNLPGFCEWNCGGRTTFISQRVAKTISPPTTKPTKQQLQPRSVGRMQRGGSLGLSEEQEKQLLINKILGKQQNNG